MRVSKFKGKDKAGNWHFGDVLHHDHGVVVIVDDAGKQHKIIPETRSEFTGAYDYDNHEIFEGDILLTNELTKENSKSFKAVVFYGNGTFYAKYINLKGCMDTSSNVPLYMVLKFSNSVKVIGNIHDNE